MTRIGETPSIHVTLPLDTGEWLYELLQRVAPEKIEEAALENLETAVLAIEDAITEVKEG